MIGSSVAPQAFKDSLCRAAWAYDALRSRNAASLVPSVNVPFAIPGAGVNICVSLVGDPPADAEVTLTVCAGGLPAAQLQRSLELAMISGHTELEFDAVWRHGGSSTRLKWRCALVEWSIAISMDRAADKLIGLLVHCLASASQAPYACEAPVPSPIDLHPAKSQHGPLASSLQQAARRATSQAQWAISVFQDVSPATLWPEHGGVHLVPPVDRFWADPFLAREGDRLWVFFEELLFTAPKGTIRCVSVDRSGNVGEPIDVLEEDCHLSYPNVFRHDGHWYMLPESSERGDLTLYVARTFPAEWVPVSRLLTNVRVADATLHRQDGAWWIMAGSADSPGGTLDDTLRIYTAPDLFGPWVAASRHAVRSDPSCSRPAGPLFEWNGRWVRPVQDCRGRYGRALHLLEMDHLDRDGPKEHLIASLYGDAQAGTTCTHTYCRVGNDLAVDWLRWRPRWSKRPRAPRLRFAHYRGVC
ncbi:MAG: hypothetical protein U1E89_03430 [Burkholderiaceae bacterium]